MKSILTTDRLIFRELHEADAASLFELDSDPEVMRFIGPMALDSVEAYAERIRDKFQPTYAEYPSLGVFAVIEKSTGDFLGWFHLTPALKYRFSHEAGFREGDVDLGYRLRRAAWGKGYATEGSVALVRSAFDKHGATRVVAVTLSQNAASIRVLEKAGLRRDSEFSIPGYEDLAVRFVTDRK